MQGALGEAADSSAAVAVKEHDFKKCDQSGFCKRNRAYADAAVSAGSSWEAPYRVLAESASVKDGQLQATILKTVNDKGDTVRLPLTVSFLQSGVARVTVDEEKRQKKEIELRHNSIARKERYNEAEQLVIVGGLALDKDAKAVSQDKTAVTVKYGPAGKFEAHIKFAPFAIDFKRDGVSQIKFNDGGLLNVEHWRPKVDKPEPEKKEEAAEEKKDGEEAKKAEGEAAAKSGDDESTWWEESFGGNTDTKPRGPESVAMDISFVGYEHVYGIPSHAGPLSLKQTRGGDGNYAEPYRLYNLDVFEYILDSPMTLYGAIPFMQGHSKDSTVGVFWLNAAETWIDITKARATNNPLSLGLGAKTTTHTHWMSESGLLDAFVFLGPSAGDVARRYGELTGYTAMPQEFAIGYHQCRWNYVSDDDVREVDRKMDKFAMPYDVIWLDIEYTDGKKYFTWDPQHVQGPGGHGPGAGGQRAQARDHHRPAHQERGRLRRGGGAQGAGAGGAQQGGQHLRGLVLAGLVALDRRLQPGGGRVVAVAVPLRRLRGHGREHVRVERHERAVRVQRARDDHAQGQRAPRRLGAPRRAQSQRHDLPQRHPAGAAVAQARRAAPAVRADARLLRRLAAPGRHVDRRQPGLVGPPGRRRAHAAEPGRGGLPLRRR